jgi:predicted ABC-type ATPase
LPGERASAILTAHKGDTMPPQIAVVAGPNGAGKSTLSPRLLSEVLEISNFVNADVIAQGLNGFDPESWAL